LKADEPETYKETSFFLGPHWWGRGKKEGKVGRGKGGGGRGNHYRSASDFHVGCIRVSGRRFNVRKKKRKKKGKKEGGKENKEGK